MNRKLVASLPELKKAAVRLVNLITGTRKNTGAVSIDISSRSMTFRTAEGFYKTLTNGADCLSDYFVSIREEDLLGLV